MLAFDKVKARRPTPTPRAGRRAEAAPPRMPGVGLLAFSLAFALAGCGAETVEEKDDRVIVRLSFDEVSYVDQGIQTHKLIERVRHQTESVFLGLRRANVLVTAKKQVDVDLGRLEKQPVTVVDSGSGITRAAVRVRYHFVGLALVPAALAKQAELPLGVLHAPDATRADQVLPVCTANGDPERAAVAELWTVFDPTLGSCADAMAQEQAAIDVARTSLEHPDKEIVSSEFERVYLPIVAELHQRGDKARPGGPSYQGRGEAHGEGRISDESPDVAPTRARVDDDEDEESLHRMRGGGLGGPVGQSPFNWGGGHALEPNWAVVYFAIASVLLLILGKRRQSGRK